MKIHPAPQNSTEWLEARAGLPTASEFHQLLTPKFELRTGEMPKTYVAQKLAEKWFGGPLMSGSGSTFAMDQGSILEQTAIPWYEFEFSTPITRVGLCIRDDLKAGCSPDGLIGELSGIEIKCPEPTNHTKYLLNGTVPPDYLCQVHGSMYVTGRKQWVFMSFRKMFPTLIVPVQWDEEIDKKISEALDSFHERFEAGWQKLLELNGGPPPKRESMTFAHEFRSEIPS